MIRVCRLYSFFLTCCALLTCSAYASEIVINPKATYLRTQSDPSAVDAVPIDLFAEGFFPGDVIRIERLGSFTSSTGTGYTGTQVGMAAVFSSSASLGASNLQNRVTGAIDAGSDVSTPPTQLGNLATNISQDFGVTDLQLTVPINATHLFVTPIDRFFGDNTGSDFKIKITTIASGVIFTSNDEIDESNTFFEGLNVVVRGCTVTITGAHNFYALTVENGGVVNHQSNNPAGVNLALETDLSVDASSSINANAKGFPVREGPGSGQTGSTTTWGSGGGHGGRGGSTPQGLAGGSVYGSIKQPSLMGSGGGGVNGGAGGGRIKLVVGGTLSVAGTISANGQDYQVNDGAGSGSGGSIWIEANTITGTGFIFANGGVGSYGGGSGGRIALYYTSNIGSLNLQTFGGAGNSGGQRGAAGTIFTKSAAQANGTLTLSSNATGAETEIGGSNTFDNVLIGANANLTVPANTDNFLLNVTQDLLIEAGGILNANGKGFPARQGPGAGLSDSTWGSGGGHGGRGGSTPQGLAGGSVYGSIKQPSLMGSGGGGVNGGAGGGRIKLVVGGTLSVAGTISANGQDYQVNDGAGSGSGGSIWIEANTITGTGFIFANGGVGSYGGGSGGRIALYYTSNIGSLNLQTFGGAGNSGGQRGAAGTIFTKSAAQNIGSLRISNSALGAFTEMIGEQAYEEITIDGYAVVGPPPRVTSLHLIASGNLTVGINARVDASHRGFLARQGPGAGQTGSNTTWGSGGGYGGRGGATPQGLQGGLTYATCVDPVDMGSGGGGVNGGMGGGVLRLSAGGTLQVDGVIASNGQDYQVNDGAGGGSGGSIWLTGGTISGNGLIQATGGVGSYGGGGGGRVALYANTFLFNFSGFNVSGGAGNNGGSAGQMGTIFAGNPVLPTAYMVTVGEEFAGDLASLFSVDNNMLQVFNDPSSLQAEVTVIGVAPTLTPQLIGLSLSTKVDRPGLAQTSEVFRYSDSTWEIFAGNVAVPAGLKVGACFSTTASNYIGSGGEIKMRVRWLPINDEDPSQDGWLHSLDQVQWRVVN